MRSHTRTTLRSSPAAHRGCSPLTASAPPHRARSKSIGECKSKQEEDKILAAEVATLRQRFTEQLSPKKMKEAVVRMM